MTSVEAALQEFRDIRDILRARKEMSLEVAFADHARRTVLIASASHFEAEIIQGLDYFARLHTNDNLCAVTFIQRKAIIRQYHSLFDWDKTSASQFFSLFGSSFSERMKAKLKEDEMLSEGLTAFLEIGRDRNRLVHGNYFVFAFEKTAEELAESHAKAAAFVSFLKKALVEWT